MKLDSVLTALASNRRRILRVAAPALACAVLLFCAVGVGHALVGNGFTVWSWGTTTDTTGTDIGSTTDRTCFLSGVSGNLNDGSQLNFGCGNQGEESMAWVVYSPSFNTGHYSLVAHGGACSNQTNQKVWDKNPVNAQATCFWTTDGMVENEWKTGNNNLPVKLAGLNAPNNKVRHCFLSGLWGVGGAWNSGSDFARVRKVTATDNTHPTVGWYIEANLPQPADGSHPRVDGRCVDFPANTTITTSTTPLMASTTTIPITSGAGIKGCALMGIKGAFNVNSWTNGVVMNFPPKIDGNWSLTVTGGKTATWACAR